MKHDECIRLYDKHGKHRLSIRPCAEGDFEHYDIVLPSGENMFCSEMPTLVKNLQDLLQKAERVM